MKNLKARACGNSVLKHRRRNAKRNRTKTITAVLLLTVVTMAFKRGADRVSLSGGSVKSLSSITRWQVTNFPNFSVQPGQCLTADGSGPGGVNNLPAPDVAGTIAMSLTTGAAARVSTTVRTLWPARASALHAIYVGLPGQNTSNSTLVKINYNPATLTRSYSYAFPDIAPYATST